MTEAVVTLLHAWLRDPVGGHRPALDLAEDGASTNGSTTLIDLTKASATPAATTTATANHRSGPISRLDIRRRPRIGGILNEYHHVA